MQTELHVDNDDKLAAFCNAVTNASWLAVDTEFKRESTYYPELCLVQVGTEEVAACIDTMAIDDLSPLLDLLWNPGILKVMHAASQDLEIFYQLRNSVPGPIFDTQLAAPLLGYQDQIGYGNLVREMLGITLDKSQTRTDWSRRPLSDAQLNYAAGDVIYLAEMYPRMRDELQRRGRLEWLQGDFQRLTAEERFKPDPGTAWKRLKAAKKLRGGRLAVLIAVTRWREEQAIKSNRPRKWILKDDTVVDVANQLPGTEDALSRISSLSPKTLQRHGKNLLDLVARNRDMPAPPVEVTDRQKKPSAMDEAMIDCLSAMLRMVCNENDLNPVSVATRKDLQKIVNEQSAASVLSGWKYAIAGERLEGLLSGRLALTGDNGSPVILE